MTILFTKENKLKVTFEFDTSSENFDPQELWIMKHADNMWNALVEIRSELRENGNTRQNKN